MDGSLSDDRLRIMRRFADCENALEGPFREIVEEALASGWSETEVATALIGLTIDMLSRDESSSSQLCH